MNILGIDFDETGVLLLAAIGAPLAWLVVHRLATQRDARNRHVAACEKFRNAVHSTLAGLYPSPINWPARQYAIIEDLEGRFGALDSAVSEFSYHLSPWQRLFLKRAWCIYRLGNSWRGIHGHGQNYWQYVGIRSEAASFNKRVQTDNTATYKATFKRNVERLLSYAKEA